MKTSILILATLAVAQADHDWSKIFHRDLDVSSKIPVALRPGRVAPVRIVGGNESVPHSRKYQVGLLLPIAAGTSFCGGSLITRRTVLTAAHCVDSLTGPVEVILGAHEINKIEPTQIRESSKQVVIHPKWDAGQLINDVALIILPKEVEINANIETVKLARNPSVTYEGDQALASGWGKDSDSSNSISSVLREVVVPVLSNDVCNIAFFGSIGEGHICTSGSDGKSTCSGDSGGPLVVDGELVGVVSFGISFGCEVGWPAAYSRVTSYIDWIEANSV